MDGSERDVIASTNAALEALIADTRRALSGQAEFGVAHVRALSDRLQAMAPIVNRAAELRRTDPRTGTALDTYTDLLGQLQTTLEQIHVLLLAQQAQMQYRQVQLHCIGQWASALRQTQ